MTSKVAFLSAYCLLALGLAACARGAGTSLDDVVNGMDGVVNSTDVSTVDGAFIDASVSETTTDDAPSDATPEATADTQIQPLETPNLIINGDGESALGSSDGSPVATPGWQVTGEGTAVQYGAAGGYPASSDPGPSDRGSNFLAGGTNDGVSTLTQPIDVSRFAANISAGNVNFALGGYLGGWQDTEDNAVLDASFKDGAGTEVGTARIGPVTAADRTSVTGLLSRTSTGIVPAATRTILVTVTMNRASGSTNDGYADSLTLVLRGP